MDLTSAQVKGVCALSNRLTDQVRCKQTSTLSLPPRTFALLPNAAADRPCKPNLLGNGRL